MISYLSDYFELAPGDVILSVNGEPVDSAESCAKLLRSTDATIATVATRVGYQSEAAFVHYPVLSYWLLPGKTTQSYYHSAQTGT